MRSVKEIEADLATVNLERDRLTASARGLSKELAEAHLAAEVAAMTPERRKALAESLKIAPPGIESEEAVGTLGSS